MIDRVTAKLGRKLYEVPVGFKWFVDGLLDGSLGFGGEESAGAAFKCLDSADVLARLLVAGIAGNSHDSLDAGAKGTLATPEVRAIADGA